MIYNANKDSIKIAAKLLNNGEIIIYPTDTIYGFGVDATNSKAIMNLNKIKQREQPYSIIVSSINMLKKYIKLPSITSLDLNKYFPGPYTLIFTKNKNNLSDLVSLNLNTIGIRIPNHNFPCESVNKLKKPMITTSINIHNSKPIVEIDQITANLSNFNIFKDSKTLNQIQSSTIIDVTNNTMKILRQGSGVVVS